MRVGVLGTMVWDRIHARDVRVAPVEEWGGIAYALAGARAAAPPDWTVVPVLRIGADLAEEALAFLGGVPGLDLESGVRVVPQPNNRVELRYRDAARRLERLSGGVGAWSWAELEPVLDGLDALYINFISGFELELETMMRVRMRMRGPIYADVHSLLLGISASGMRMLRPLERWRDWMSCFDIAQLNEDELGALAGAWGDPWLFAADVVGDMPRLLLVTLGERGAAYVASPMFRPEPLRWRDRDAGLRLARPLAAPGPARSGRVDAPAPVDDGDPTGCGDVWGATTCMRLLAGAELETAMRDANEAAGRNVRHRGATGLYDHLKGRLAL